MPQISMGNPCQQQNFLKSAPSDQVGQRQETSASSPYALIALTNKALQPLGEWNRARVLMPQDDVESWLNDCEVVEYDLSSESIKAVVTNSQFQNKWFYAAASTG